MGIVCVAFTATDATIERVHADPPLVWLLYAPDEPEFYLDEIGAGRKPGFLARLFGAKETPVPDALPRFDHPDGARLEVDLDKSWDGINFCMKRLRGVDAPNVFEDGRPVGNVEVGYGPAMTFDAVATRALCDEFSAVDAAAVVGALDPAAMSDVYPGALWERDDDDTRSYVKENFKAMRAFLEQAAGQGLGIVVVYT